ncbi:MAG: homoserine dehydrogenase [Mariprofundaceae bacterium]|nr:homoserine dehydrogenase [Mariprofundaceae bacterium]
MTNIRVGLIGFGTIGTGVARNLLEQSALLQQRLGKSIQLLRICDRDISHDRGLDLRGVELTDNIDHVIKADDIDLVIELIGGYEPARSFVQTAIEHGKHVVTANKALIAKHGDELFVVAEKHGVSLAFEAAVGGGIACLKALREGLAGNEIQAVFGILNGTCNYILTRMENEGLDFDVVLKDAQDLGYAEADPSFDVDGVDTAHKLAILSAMAFGTKIAFDAVHTEGIRQISAQDIQSATELGYRIKLLGITRPHGDQVEMRVHPTLVPLDSQIAQVSDSYNAVLVDGDYVEKTIFIGRGAGEKPTASAVISDVMDIARAMPDGIKHLAPPMGFPQANRRPFNVLPIVDVECAYYLRLMVKDQPGVMASITNVLADHRISLEAITQKERHETEAVAVVMLVHETREGNLQAAIDRIMQFESVEDQPLILRIERFGE